MSVIKYTTKYMMFSVLALLVIFTIGGFILHRQKKETKTVIPPDSSVETPSANTLRPPQSQGAGHFHADGTWHADTPTPPTVALPKESHCWQKG